jgi:hypothetical protein
VEDGIFVPFWCLWREINDRSFEHRERTLEELKSFFFNTLYLWTVAFVSALVLSYRDFFFFFVFSTSS